MSGLTSPDIQDLPKTAPESSQGLPGTVLQQPETPPEVLRDCMRSLAFPEMDNRFNDVEDAEKGTCNWLRPHPAYKRWAACDRGILWIKGKPGSGKSTLLRYALKDEKAMSKAGDSALVLSFFFHGRGNELQRTPLGLFRSLLYGLLDHVPEALADLVGFFQDQCKRKGKAGEKWQWHPHELLRFFESSLPKVLETRPVWLFVDALDECGETNAVSLVERFKALVKNFPSTGLHPIHICFTCRHYPILDIGSGFEVCLEHENQGDIATYVQNQLSEFRMRTASTIPTLIKDRAHGVFLWAYLVVNQVRSLERQGEAVASIEAHIRSVPQELDDLYRELIRGMGPSSLKLIQWICFATRPLSLDELLWAMVIDADCPHRSLEECRDTKDYMSDNVVMKRRVQTLSHGLIEVTPSSGVQFIHQSVKDFFVEKGLASLDGSSATTDWAIGIAHRRLSRICIRYLAMDEIGSLMLTDPRDSLFINNLRDRHAILEKFPFLHYAATSWVAHTKQSDDRKVPQEDLLEDFAWPSSTLMKTWVDSFCFIGPALDRPAEGTNLTHVLARHGVSGLLRFILEEAGYIDINIQDGFGRTPLRWAAEEGHSGIVRLLLEHGANVEIADIGHRTPLHIVASQGDEPMARLFLEKGANTEAADLSGETSLLKVVNLGNEAMAQLLLDKGANIEAADKYGETPLWKVVNQGNEAMIRLLLDRGANTEAAGLHGWTPLWKAVSQGKKATVQLLLDKGANIEAADRLGRTPLLRNTQLRNEAAARLLLEKGANVEAVDKNGRTPLWWAAREKYETIVQLLLEGGANTETADQDDLARLWRASWNKPGAIELLLQPDDARVSFSSTSS